MFKRALRKASEWLLAITVVAIILIIFMWFGVLILSVGSVVAVGVGGYWLYHKTASLVSNRSEATVGNRERVVGLLPSILPPQDIVDAAIKRAQRNAREGKTDDNTEDGRS